jgi:ankyrin repeat protein
MISLSLLLLPFFAISRRAAESGNPEIYNFIWQQVAHAPRNPVAAVPIVRSTLAEDYTIEFLLERDPSIIYHRDPIGSRLPIHAAAAKGHNQVLRWILARAPQQARATDINGRTPLHEVALRGNQEAFSLLLQHGARLSAVDMFGNTVLSEALSGHVDDRWEMVDQIIDNEDVDIFLGFVMCFESINVVSLFFLSLLTLKVVPHSNPVTTMKQAIKGGFLEVVKRLAAKPDISIGEHANELVTAISKVLDTYPGEAIQILETVLATKPKFSETTPILVSVLKSSTLDDKSALSVVQPLLAAGANPNLASLDNKTALSVAVDGSWPSVVDALLKAGATVDNEAHSKRYAVYGEQLIDSASHS